MRLVFVGLAFACACREPVTNREVATDAVPVSSVVPTSALPDSGPGVSTPLGPRPTMVRDGRVYVPALPGTMEPSELPEMPKEPFASNTTYPECLHPGVESSCADGWCRIPPGCYIYGSPEAEPGRIDSREQQGPVTLTRAFEIQQYEVTNGEWHRVGLTTKAVVDPPCQDDECPAVLMSWFEAALYANLRSKGHLPPLPECYVLEGCTYGELGYECQRVGTAVDTIYDCGGYRLPTRAEWQYAARAGTTTSYYSGPISVTEADEQLGCPEDVNLNPVAWYCYNSMIDSHPVGKKWPNGWGLYDMLGNVSELLHEPDHARSPVFPAVDPFGEVGSVGDGRPFVGGPYIGKPSLTRAASGLQASPGIGTKTEGFRLVRTLPSDDAAPTHGEDTAP